MADVESFIRFRKVLECSICLELFDDPKMLQCTHEFCKRCLEGMLTFHEDGSAVITCPLRCDEDTVLNSCQTVCNLAASYTTKNMLDTLKTEDQGSAIPSGGVVCNAKKNCTRHVSMVCCQKAMCNSCCYTHIECSDALVKHRSLNLSFNRKENKLMILCDRHSAECSHLCVDDSFLCLYCIHRDHKNHARNTIETEANLLREAVINEMETKKKALDYRKAEFTGAKEQLIRVLKQRKEECLSKYASLLEEEENKLVEEMEYIEANLNENEEKLSMPESGITSHCTNIMDWLDIETVLKKEEILNKINVSRSALKENLFVSLSKDYDYMSPHPLGEITVEKKKSTRGIDMQESSLQFSIPCKNTIPENMNMLSFLNDRAECKDNYPGDCLFKDENNTSDEVIPKNSEKNENASNAAELADEKEEEISLMVLKEQGNAYFKQHQYHKAIECYSKAIKLYPEGSTSELSVVYQNRAAANEKLKRWSEVVEDCTIALQLNPLYTKAIYRKSTAHEQLGETGCACADIVLANYVEQERGGSVPDEKSGREKHLLCILSTNLVQEAHKAAKPSTVSADQFRQFIRQFQYNPFTISISTAVDDLNYSDIMKYMKTGEYEKVFELCENEMRSLGKHKDRACLLRGTLKLLMQQDDEALTDLSKISHLSPTEDNKILRLYSHLLMAEQKYVIHKDINGCFEALNCALQIDKYDATVHCFKGRYHRLSGEMKEAEVNLKLAVSLDQTYFEPRFMLADYVAASHRHMLNKEIEHAFLKLIKDFPDDSEGYYAYHCLLIDVGRIEEAEKYIDKAILLEPGSASYCGQKRVIRVSVDPEEGEKLLKKAIKIDKNDGYACTAFGEVELYRGNHAAGIKYLQKGINLMKNCSPYVADPTLHACIRIQKNTEYTQKAREYYKQHRVQSQTIESAN